MISVVKVITAKAAKTVGETQQRADDLRAELARRDVHLDVLSFCRAELMQQNYFPCPELLDIQLATAWRPWRAGSSAPDHG
jgi:hypothetical protein